MSNDTYSGTYFSSNFPFNQPDENSFHHGSLNYVCGRVETLLFNPIERPEFCNHYRSSYLDPDSNLLLVCPLVNMSLRKNSVIDLSMSITKSTQCT